MPRQDTPTLGGLWGRYAKAREDLERLRASEGERSGDLCRLERRVRNLRERLLVDHAPLVRYVAGRMGARLRRSEAGYVANEDLLSWGLTGLLSAIEHYDPGDHRGAKFESYAISKIRWAILDGLRDEGWVPYRVRRRARQAERTATGLRRSLGRGPTESEVAAEMGMGLREYRNLLERCSRARVASLEVVLASGEGPKIKGSPTAAGDPVPEAGLSDLRTDLATGIAALKEKERSVLTLHYYEGLTLKEIARGLGLSEGRVSQIRRRALSKLSGHLLPDRLSLGGLRGGNG
jgi:RNA polymerase sigma factor FliA